MTVKAPCPICGKKARRPCPALNRPICSLCCGRRRGIEIECSADCAFSPYSVAGYDLWLRLDGQIIPKLAGKVISEYGRDRFQEVMDSIPAADRDDDEDLEATFHAAFYYLLLVEKDSEGKTLVERWADEGWQGLEPDEALMMRYRARSFVTVIEVQKILDHQRLECLDLFAPGEEPFVILDRSLPKQAVRFSRIFGWLTHYPNFSRPGFIGFPLAQLIREDFIDEIYCRCEEETGRDDENTVKEYMAEHFWELVEMNWKWPGEKMREMLRGMDSHHCAAEYLLEAPREEIEEFLDSRPDFRWSDRDPEEGDPPGTDYYEWVRDGESRALEKEMIAPFRYPPASGQVGTLANLKITDDRLILETFTRQKYLFARKMLDKYFPGKLKFQREKIVDIARQAAAEKEEDGKIRGGRPRPPPSREKISPEVKAEVMKQFYRDRYTRFLDEEIPALNGLTPRQAAADPLSRRLLVDLMKGHLFGIESKNREERMDISIDFALRELGLEELIASPRNDNDNSGKH